MMTTIDIGEAATQLTQLIDRVLAGEEIAFARGGLPVAQISPITPRPLNREPRELGQIEGKMWISPDFDALLPEEISPTAPETAGPKPLGRRQVSGQLRGDPWLTSIDLDAPLDEEVARAFGMLDE